MLSQRLKEYRDSHNLKQWQLADILGLTRAAVTAYESGNKRPDYKGLLNISSKLDLSIDYLVGKVDNSLTQTEQQDIRFIIELNSIKPRNLRIKTLNFQGKGFYGLCRDCELELIDPFEERDRQGDGRIYLRFVNTINAYGVLNQIKNILSFLQVYGFVGRVTETPMSNESISDIIERCSRVFQEVDYINADNSSHMHAIETSLRENDREYESFIISESDPERFRGIYLEFPDMILSDVYRFHNLVMQTVSNSNIPGAISIINRNLMDIRIQYVNAGDFLHQTFAYRSLFSLMHLELLFDIKNGKLPIQCTKCKDLFIPGTKGEIICRNCK